MNDDYDFDEPDLDSQGPNKGFKLEFFSGLSNISIQAYWFDVAEYKEWIHLYTNHRDNGPKDFFHGWIWGIFLFGHLCLSASIEKHNEQYDDE